MPTDIDALLIYRALEQVPDERHKRGIRYSVALVVTLVLLGKAAGMTTPQAIAEWVRLRAKWFQKVLPGTIDKSTYRKCTIQGRVVQLASRWFG